MTAPMQYAAVSGQQLIIWNTSGTTDATGAITFALPAGTYQQVYTAQAQAVRDTVNPTTACFACVRSFSTTSVVVQVFESKTTSVPLGGATVEGLEKSAVATNVLLNVFGI